MKVGLWSSVFRRDTSSIQYLGQITQNVLWVLSVCCVSVCFEMVVVCVGNWGLLHFMHNWVLGCGIIRRLWSGISDWDVLEVSLIIDMLKKNRLSKFSQGNSQFYLVSFFLIHTPSLCIYLCFTFDNFTYLQLHHSIKPLKMIYIII